MPVPRIDRLTEYAQKGLELLLRTVGEAPEQRSARRLAAQWQPNGAARDSTPKVVVLSPRDWAAHVQYEAVIAQALRMRGADVTFITCGGRLEICDRANTYEAPPMPCATCSRYTTSSLEAHGFALRQLREFWSDDDVWPELDEVPKSDLGSVTSGDLPLGQLVDVPLKWFLCTAKLDLDPLAGLTQRAFLRSARRIARSVEALLDELQPDTVLLLNGLFLFEAVTWAICKQRGIDVVTYERAFRQETLVFHRGEPAGFYDFAREFIAADRPLQPSEEAELDAYVENRERGSAFDQYWRFTERAIERGTGRLACLFTNLTWDSAVIDRDIAFANIETWLTHAIDHFAARPKHRLVVRVHPSELALPGKQTRDSLADYIAAKYPSLPENVTVIAPDDLTSSYPLMDASDFGLVYTSTTGLEMALRGKPVILAGETHYRGKGFTTDASTPADFDAAVSAALDDPTGLAPNVDAARRYAHFFFFRAPVDAPGVREPLPGLARITVTDLADLAEGANPDLDRICNGLLRGTPFVE